MLYPFGDIDLDPDFWFAAPTGVSFQPSFNLDLKRERAVAPCT